MNFFGGAAVLRLWIEQERRINPFKTRRALVPKISFGPLKPKRALNSRCALTMPFAISMLRLEPRDRREL